MTLKDMHGGNGPGWHGLKLVIHFEERSYMRVTYQNHLLMVVTCRHEIVGVVTEVGSNVTKFKVGDRVGAGYVAESCEKCEACSENMESMCQSKAGVIRVFNAIAKDGTITRGGFSDIMVSNQR